MESCYKVYGLNIFSEIVLPELEAGNGQTDVVIRFGQVEKLQVEGDRTGHFIQIRDNQVQLAWQGVGKFLVRDGREIIVDPAPGVLEPVMRLFLLGTTLAMLLHQRGKMVFHASVVAINGQGVAFAGPKGAGKSTMVAALRERGHKLVSDDLLVIDDRQQEMTILPGFPHLKLWPDAIASLGYTPEEFPQLRPDLDIKKRGHRINSGFVNEPVPLKCVCILAHGPKPEIEQLAPQEALTEIMPHWYAARFGMDVLQAMGVANHFLHCAALTNKVKIYRLKRPASLPDLPEVARLVENDPVCQPGPVA